jgi:AcrR family transcriptional regulator
MTATTRAYLRADDRRRQLLDAAAIRFRRDGYAGLTMVAIAEEAGVSRRLVYNHFADLAALYEAFFDDRVLRYLDSIDRAVGEAGDDPLAAFAGAFSYLVTMPADDQRVIRLLVADPGDPQLGPMRERLRAHIESRWLPPIRARAPGDELARGLLWTMVSGLLGLADLASREEISVSNATRLAHALVTSVPRTFELAPAR